MNESTTDSTTSAAPVADKSQQSASGLSAAAIPALAALVLFIVAALFGGDIADRGLLPLVRFISLLMLALAIYTSVMVGRYCSYSPTRWKVGQVAAACIALAGGLVWSASSFGLGFVLFMTGTFMCAVLIFKEMERKTNRRLARRKPQAG